MNNQWQPGALLRLPWGGFAALLGAIGGVASSIVVLILSNGDPITRWSFQPTVYLSIISTLTNIMIHYALSQGITTAWWNRALKTNTKIADLHHFWATGNSLLAAINSGRNFNLVALASILVAVSQVNGPLLQRASRVVLVEVLSNVPVLVRIAPEIPLYYTGVVTGREYTPAFFTPAFLPVVSDFYDRSRIQLNDTGCNGMCYTTVAGAGFAINCSGYETIVNASDTSTYNVSQPLDDEGLQVFQSDFGWAFGSVTTCTLSPATVKYSVVIDGNQSTISLPTGSTIYDDEIITDYNIHESYEGVGLSAFGGLYFALANQYNSETNIRFAAALGYVSITNGSTASQFLLPNSTYDCGLSFADPTTNLTTYARELMFRTAIAAANSSNIQSVRAVQRASIAVYQSHYLYLALASGFTSLAVIMVLPTFFGYWHLGRKVSMSPIEIAKAFNAPLLKNNDSNADSSQLVKDLGDLGVRYGAASIGSGTSDPKDTKQGISASQAELSGKRLEMAPPGEVMQPQKGWVFIS
ncbi:hypothetical protein N431DRAFT_450566 [Stipitochalara longipes BDJ]|nr:hypothetical protein N431DRAFT_450566 [Stipitochalara longipes BDJ]